MLYELGNEALEYLARQVRRNRERFPNDFIFCLTVEELRVLRCQFGTLEISGKGCYSSWISFRCGVILEKNKCLK
ncbi:MAG: ORF6N domain-containing protein [Candidatus Omnitrophica bacterium]|nr:ORF6N domain-containing protein [Candidatus Omnitrophota bacterium]